MSEIKRRDHIAEVRPAGPRSETPPVPLVVTDEVHRHSPAQVREVARLARRIEAGGDRRPAA
jgi:hypothetical protein